MHYTIFDAHCDTISCILDGGGELCENKYHFDIKRATKNGGACGQVFAAFVDKNKIDVSPCERANLLIDTYFREILKNTKTMQHCTTFKEIKDTLNENKMAAVLAIEGGEAIEGDLSRLEAFYNRGVRIMTLTWNYENEICDGISVKNGKGLSEFGKDVVLKMNDLGMIIDVSHISEKGFWDVIETSRAPVCATHSNAYSVMNHPRNLSDEQIRALIKADGFIGINFFAEFLSKMDCTINDILKHIEHILALGGENVLGIGTDFDGCDLLSRGINGVEDVCKLIEGMEKIGYSNEIISKITSGNFLRVAEIVLK